MKKHRTRRWLALLLTAGMLVGLVPADGTQAVHAAGEFDADADLLAHYPLETDVKDVSGNDKDASITDGASGVDFSGDALNLAGGARSTGNYVTLPDGLFDGQDTVTVSLWISNHGNQTNTAAFFFGSAPEGTLQGGIYKQPECRTALDDRGRNQRHGFHGRIYGSVEAVYSCHRRQRKYTDRLSGWGRSGNCKSGKEGVRFRHRAEGTYRHVPVSE